MRLPVLMIALLAAPVPALAGPGYAIDWHTIDGGGGTSTGGVYTLSGTIGQPDASGPATGADHTLTGGFWASPAAPPCLADLDGNGLLDLADINTFVSGFLANDPIADLDGNGLFDLTDINTFVSAFLAGCP